MELGFVPLSKTGALLDRAEGMTSSPHDPADCELAVCDRCDSYGDGFSAGKAAAHFEVRV